MPGISTDHAPFIACRKKVESYEKSVGEDVQCWLMIMQGCGLHVPVCRMRACYQDCAVYCHLTGSLSAFPLKTLLTLYSKKKKPQEQATRLKGDETKCQIGRDANICFAHFV